MSSQYRIVTRYPTWRYVIIITLVVITGMWFYTNRHYRSPHNLSVITNSDSEILQDDTKAHPFTNALKEQMIALKRNLQIEKQTIKQLQAEIITQQDEIYRLKKELEFYSGIMSEAAKTNGLKIHSLHAEAITDSGGYYFKLILTRAPKNDRMAKGMLSILIEGVLDDAVKTIDIKELTTPESLPLTFEFSSFERIGVNAVLPRNFMPHRIIVRARQDKKVALERIFEWTEIVKN